MDIGMERRQYGRCTQRRCKQRLYDCHSDGCGAVKSLQQGFCAGLNSISSMRTKSGSNTLSCHLPSLPICECSLPCSFQPCDSRMACAFFISATPYEM